MSMQPQTARARLNLALPLLAGLLVLVLAALPFVRAGHSLAEWPLVAVATPERIMTLAGLGILLGQFPRKYMGFALGLLIAAGASAYLLRERIFHLLAEYPAAAPNAFFTAPAAGLAVGLALVLPRRARPYLAPPLLALAGAALMLSTALGDPTLHSLSYLPSALLFEAWLVFVVMGLARATVHPFAVTGGQIFASWMVAISLLYGGALIVDKKKVQLTPPPFAEAPATGEYPGFAAVLSALDAGQGRAR